MRVLLDEASHSYTVGGKVKPSVTQILGAVGARVTTEEGTFWRSFFDYTFLADSTRETALARGRWVADLIAWRLRQKPAWAGLSPAQRGKLAAHECYPGIIGEAWLPFYDCWERWFLGRRDLRTILVEQPLYDETLDCCGSPDWFGTMSGVYTVLDWKTGIASADARYQTAAYEQMIRGYLKTIQRWKTIFLNGTPYIARGVLELHDDGTDARLFMLPVSDLTNDRGVFMAARRIYQVHAEGQP